MCVPSEEDINNDISWSELGKMLLVIILAVIIIGVMVTVVSLAVYYGIVK